MHRQHEHRALIPGLVEFIDPYLGNFPRRSVVRALHVEERRIVQDPLDRYLDDARWLAVLQELIRAVVGHHRAFVGESELANDRQRGGREIPGWRAIAGRFRARHLRQVIKCPPDEIALDVSRYSGVHLVYPAVHRELVMTSGLDDVGHLGMEHQAHSWNEK